VLWVNVPVKLVWTSPHVPRPSGGPNVDFMWHITKGTKSCLAISNPIVSLLQFNSRGWVYTSSSGRFRGHTAVAQWGICPEIKKEINTQNNKENDISTWNFIQILFFPFCSLIPGVECTRAPAVSFTVIQLLHSGGFALKKTGIRGHRGY
jgi:hypothetical protein